MPALSKSLFLETLNKEPLFDVFVQAGWASWAFLLRALSARLPLVRQLPRGKIEGDPILNAPAVMRKRGGQIAIKLRGRGHMAVGPRIVRKCICEEYAAGSPGIRVLQPFCQACPSLVSVLRRSPAGEQLFPGLSGPGFADKLRGATRHFGREKADRLGTYSAGRVAARSILETGGSLAQLLLASQWRSSAYSLYADMGPEEAKAMDAILFGAADDKGAGRQGPQG